MFQKALHSFLSWWKWVFWERHLEISSKIKQGLDTKTWNAIINVIVLFSETQLPFSALYKNINNWPLISAEELLLMQSSWSACVWLAQDELVPGSRAPAMVFCLFSSQITFCYRFPHLDDRSGCCLQDSPSCNCTLISNCLEEIQSIQATRRRLQMQQLDRKENRQRRRAQRN